MIAGGRFPARGLGMTSTAKHECLLRFAAFLDGGFPSSAMPPEIIAISRTIAGLLFRYFFWASEPGLARLGIPRSGIGPGRH
ncbi:hypothetical protein PIB30_110052 [Stylosanthes scabra]|uniref:Uncharacterized protein n=1 Tax=Stylosanthes scabra TaxID=79078 RepID=A0ABU6XZC7_9FABA|nr:hypothetical protein [Stylosanthes scabra]